ncbi:hypothetical protein SELMODRAFT_449116 [Selaginella moellendorffii]|uniref:C3H1-type domain-containing protein n=1 Tax=Selaginella moellendorffii TaxID=88036 RepID=D8TCP2_SELML|nr:hypothetical protein SELMODRAFT_449116 [Selaginella moellendorffii]
MPGVLIDDMPFSLDHPASTSPFLDNLSPLSSPSSPFHQMHHHHHHLHQQSSSLLESIMATVSSPTSSSPPSSPVDSPRGTSHDAALSTVLHRFLPSNNSDEATWSAEDVYSCDEFRMFEFKVRRCMRGRSHDWTECPFAHPGEKARRRDPRRFHYSGTACPDFRKGSCKNGDACELAHGVFECWLHPARYRTQPCKDGRSCKRRVCFFAHTSEQLRLLPQVSQAMSNSPSSTTSSSSPPSSSSSNALFSSSPCSSSPSPSLPSSFCATTSPDSFSSAAFVGSPCSPRRSSASAAASLLRSFSDKPFVGSSPSLGLDSFEPSSAMSTSHCCCHQGPQQQSPRAVAACSAARLISSPTSTLVGLAQSPPPLSPPLSPSQSPPMSPSAVPRRHLDTRRLGFASAPSSPATSHHPLHNKAMCDLVTALQQLELQKSVAVPHVAGGMQHGTAGWVQCSPQYSSGPSPLRPGASAGSWAAPCAVPRGTSVSLPCTPTKPTRWDTMWEMEMGEEDLLEEQEMLSMPVPRVESGRDLRAKIYGRLANKVIGSGGNGGGGGESSGLGIGYEAGIGEPSPDLNWVNDLVTE